MHPFDAQVHGQAIMEDRHREAAEWRAIRAAGSARHRSATTLAYRLGGMLVRVGRRLQSRPHVASTLR